jgi:hypothetical protein
MAGIDDAPVSVSVAFPNVPLFGGPAAITLLVDKIMGNAAHTALAYLSDVLAEQVPHDTNALADSFRSDPATSIGGIELTGHTFVEDGLVGRVFSALPYAAAMDAGRRPGAPVSRAGLDAIALWAQRKLGLTEVEAERAKWAIAASITARGIAPHDYGNEALQLADHQLGTIFAHAGEALAAALGASNG